VSPEFPLSLCQQIEVERIIAFLEEGPLAPVSSLSDVVRNAGKDKARAAGHEMGSSGLRDGVNKLRVYARVSVIPADIRSAAMAEGRTVFYDSWW
jgi:hypothetical protein